VLQGERWILEVKRRQPTEVCRNLFDATKGHRGIMLRRSQAAYNGEKVKR
jgi:hypothetical protein